MSENIINDDIFSQSNPAYSVNIVDTDNPPEGGSSSGGGSGSGTGYGEGTSEPIDDSASNYQDIIPNVGISEDWQRYQESLMDKPKHDFAPLLGFGLVAYLILS